MPVSADTLAVLIAKGVVGDDLVDVVRAIDADAACTAPAQVDQAAERRREWDRNRKRVAAEAKRNSAELSTGIPPEQSAPPPPQRDINQTPSPPRKSDHRANDAKSILAEVLTAETAVDLVAHRKALRSPMTPGSARGLVKAFVAFGNPEAAAQAMMANGWKGFRSDWMSNPPRAGPTRRGGGRTVAEMAAMNLDDDEPDIFDGSGSHPRNGAATSSEPADASRRGFAGRLSEQDAAHARRGALLDH